MKTFILKIVLTMTFLSVLISCTPDNPSDTQTFDTSGNENNNTSGDVIIVSADTTDYKLLRPEVPISKLEITAAQTVYNALKDMNISLVFETDFVKKSVDPDSVSEKEILIGLTNRTASKEAHAKLSEDEFIIALDGKRLVCVGYTPEVTAVAAEYLVLNFIDENGLNLPAEGFMKKYKAGMNFTAKTVENPVISSGADPWVIRDGENYYYCYSTGNGVGVARAESLDTLAAANGVTVYTAPAGTMYSAEYWAPELHKLDGEWYIYVAADDGNNANHRMYVLKCTSDTPTKPFKMVGKITDKSNKWAIDGTVLTLGDEHYFVWSGWEGDVDVRQDLYISKMLSPTELAPERTLISMPQYTWEKVSSPDVNEGPVALVKDGKAFILYSASGSWTDDYCIGLLTLEGDDPLDKKSWKKSTKPILQKSSTVFGPGHCSVVEEKDGSFWAVYHANHESGSGWNGRKIYIQNIIWKDGKPAFEGGVPAAEVELPVFGYIAEKSVEVE